MNKDERLHIQKPIPHKHIDGLYDTSVSAYISRHDIESPTTINCVLSVPKTNYVKKKETIYYGEFSNFN